MFSEFKGKNVKILVSSNSGASVCGEQGRVFTSVITVFGTVGDIEGNFMELVNSTMIYYPGLDYTFNNMGLSLNNTKQPSSFENPKTLLNLMHVISISIVE